MTMILILKRIQEVIYGGFFIKFHHKLCTGYHPRLIRDITHAIRDITHKFSGYHPLAHGISPTLNSGYHPRFFKKALCFSMS